MTQQITSLTPEQAARTQEFADKWLAIGLNTDPLDFDAAKAAVIDAYAVAGLPPPVNFHRTRSPIEAINLIQKLEPSFSRSTIVNDMSYGAHEASWLANYDFFGEVVGLECCSKLEPLMRLAKCCGWLSMYDDTVVFQDRPSAIRFDDERRLHCEFGPAVEYRDGYGIYRWHGVAVPPEWILDKSSLTAEAALGQTNTELRRAACEIIGWAKVLSQLDSKVIDTDVDPQIGTLLEVKMPDGGKEKFLQVLCGTGRTFAIPVPPEVKTALEANAWTYDIEPDVIKALDFRT